MFPSSASSSLSLTASTLLNIISSTKIAHASLAYCADEKYAAGALGLSPSQTYKAAPYTPVQINYAVAPEDCPLNTETKGYFFFSVAGSKVEQAAGLIMKPDGTLVYSASGFLSGVVQYKGKDHLGLWVGTPPTTGHGFGYNLLLNKAYKVVANITTTDLNGTLSDIHEFQVTTNSTAIMTAYPTLGGVDLSSFGGPSDGYVFNGAAQEVDIETGKALFTWKALDHVDPSECYAPISVAGLGTAESPWDYFHINSIQKTDEGNYLISSRHCHTLYLVDPTGEIVWRMGGKNSSFVMGEGTEFSWQHHARMHEAGDLTYGLRLAYDESSMNVSLSSTRLPYNRTVTTSGGSVQVLEDESSIVGWAAMPYFSAHTPNGSIKWAAQFGVGSGPAGSYRVFLADWTGRPSAPPLLRISNTSSANNVTVYAWWNGATEVASWQLLGSPTSSPSSPVVLANANRTDFESVITYTGDETYDYYQVAAMNANGEVLAYSDSSALNGTTLGRADHQTAML